MTTIHELPSKESKRALEQSRQENIFYIISGQAQQYYSEWLLRGILGERFRPTVALAVFPNHKGKHDLQHLALVEIPRPVLEYWRTVSQLELPERVRRIEAIYYMQYRNVAVVGEQIMKRMSEQVLAPELPSSMVVFNQPAEEGTESAYLFAPTPVPPSVAFGQITELAQQHLTTVV